MDTVTQFVIGAAAGQVVGGRALGRTAALVGGLAGWLPDADVLIRSAADPLLAIEQHRAFTHALVFTPVGAALVAAPFLLRREWRARAGAVYAAALAGWATHAPLDACTSYGTQLLWPFSDQRIAWNVVSIVDPVITLPLLLGVVLAAWLRSAWPAAAALAVALAWLGVGALQHARAADAQGAWPPPAATRWCVPSSIPPSPTWCSGEASTRRPTAGSTPMPCACRSPGAP
ncbi:MAG: metal-dependent hydrolase [Anaeromyxobacter sp.]|nr:metal-dependent hydrolase [Anaeromyxobacter sp.]